jgi:hypothetical protein
VVVGGCVARCGRPKGRQLIGRDCDFHFRRTFLKWRRGAACEPGVFAVTEVKTKQKLFLSACLNTNSPRIGSPWSNRIELASRRSSLRIS